MTPDQIDLIKQIGDRLGVGIDYLWPKLVAYTMWVHIGLLSVDIVFVVAAVIAEIIFLPKLFKNIYLYNTRDNPEYKDYTLHGAAAFGSGGVCVLSVVIFFTCITNIPGQLGAVVVPEAQAIYDIVNLLTAKK